MLKWSANEKMRTGTNPETRLTVCRRKVNLLEIEQRRVGWFCLHSFQSEHCFFCYITFFEFSWEVGKCFDFISLAS